MGSDPRFKTDDIIGVIALVLLFIGVAIMTFLATRPQLSEVPDPDVYSTPNGNFPKESSYLGDGKNAP